MIKDKVIVWAPANISLIFKVHKNDDPQKMGSYGLGFTIDQGVTVTASVSETIEILFNNKHIDFPPVRSVLNSLTDKAVKLEIVSSLPLGCGFGLSGASVLATSYALNELFGLGKTKLELAKIAHLAEVINKTGLGDVVNQYYGGFLLKTKPSSEFVVEKIPLTNIPIYTKVFASLATSSVLTDSNKMTVIENQASYSLTKVQKLIQEGNVQLSQIFDIAREFVEKSDLIISDEVRDALKEIERADGHGTMILLGNSVVSDTPFPEATQYIISSVGAHVKK